MERGKHERQLLKHCCVLASSGGRHKHPTAPVATVDNVELHERPQGQCAMGAGVGKVRDTLGYSAMPTGHGRSDLHAVGRAKSDAALDANGVVRGLGRHGLRADGRGRVVAARPRRVADLAVWRGPRGGAEAIDGGRGVAGQHLRAHRRRHGVGACEPASAAQGSRAGVSGRRTSPSQSAQPRARADAPGPLGLSRPPSCREGRRELPMRVRAAVVRVDSG